MDSGFLNFHNEEHFSDFSLSLDHQHNLLAEAQNALVQMVDNDFDYIDSLEHDSNDASWETEQELNGDLAVLPVSGVSGVIPKVECFKEDYAKVLTDWQEHIGCLQASEIEEDINIFMGLHLNEDLDIFPEDALQNDASEENVEQESALQEDTSEENSQDILQEDTVQEDTLHEGLLQQDPFQDSSDNDLSQEDSEQQNAFDFLESMPIHPTTSEVSTKQSASTSGKVGPQQFGRNRVSESDHSEIDVVGLDSIEDVAPLLDSKHVGRQHATTRPKEFNSKVLGKKASSFEQENDNDENDDDNDDGNDTTIKKESTDFEDVTIPPVSLSHTITEFAKNSKKKNSRKQETQNKKSHKSIKAKITKISKKSKKSSVTEESNQETNTLPSVPSTSVKPVVLEAGDLDSLLEQFEASEAAISSPIPEATQPSQATKKDSPKPPVNKSQVTLLKKSIDSEDSRSHQNIRDSLPKEVIDRIKASGRKKSTISVIPAIPNTKTGRNNGTRVKETAVAPSRTKLLKLVTNNATNSKGMEASVQLDHDYCSNSNSTLNSSSSSSSNSPVESLKPTGLKITIPKKKNYAKNNSKKDSGFESGDVSDASEEQPPAAKLRKLAPQTAPVNSQKEIKSGTPVTVLDSNKTVSLLNKAPSNNAAGVKSKPVYEMKIQSALATSILQLRKTKSMDLHKSPQMVSVLKKPPAATTPQKVLGSNLKESIVTTTNSSNDQVQNIIVQDTTDVELPEETAKKPPRRKLNLAEYRSRREQARSDGSRTNSPIQPMALVYIHHVSTNTDPINDDPNNPIWSEREIVSVLKPKSEIEEEKLKPKPQTMDRGMQTIESVFGTYDENDEMEEEKGIQEEEQIQEPAAETTPEIAIDVANIKQEIVDDMMEEGEVDSEQVDNEEVPSATISEKADAVEKFDGVGSNEKSDQTSLGRIRDRKHRNYRRQRAFSSSSRSRSRSRSCDRSVRRSRSRSRSHSRSRGRSRGSRSRSSRSRSHSRSSSSDRSRSRSRSRERRKLSTRRRRRKISHRRSSVSSTSSWSSRSRSRSRSKSRSRSRYRSSSRSSRSRSRSSRYSSGSRSSSRSNYGRSKWSSRRRKGKQGYRRSYDRYRRNSSDSNQGHSDWRRSPSYRRSCDEWYIREKQRQVEERRVIYVGRLKEGITKAELRRRFEAFGPVVDISVHFRERGHNYGFVTFAYKNDAYQAVEHGNDDPSLPRYDLCFGGRRAFCKVKYADLDGAASESSMSGSRSVYKPEEENTFDLLLKEAQAKLRKRKV